MTCIVGLVDGDKAWMGGDSAGVAGLDVTIRKDPKVFKKGPFLIGYTSSFRMGQLLRFKFKPPKYYPEEYHNDEREYMCIDFIEGVRSCLKAGGYSTISSNEETAGVFLVGFNGRLFRIDSDFQVGESMETYESIGCGQDYAKGSLFSMLGVNSLSKPNEKYDPGYIVEEALNSAEHFSGGVRAPFVIESI